jgi:hypothetical protein
VKEKQKEKMMKLPISFSTGSSWIVKWIGKRNVFASFLKKILFRYSYHLKPVKFNTRQVFFSFLPFCDVSIIMSNIYFPILVNSRIYNGTRNLKKWAPFLVRLVSFLECVQYHRHLISRRKWVSHYEKKYLPVYTIAPDRYNIIFHSWLNFFFSLSPSLLHWRWCVCLFWLPLVKLYP